VNNAPVKTRTRDRALAEYIRGRLWAEGTFAEIRQWNVAVYADALPPVWEYSVEYLDPNGKMVEADLVWFVKFYGRA
jgi:hypothetical protein